MIPSAISTTYLWHTLLFADWSHGILGKRAYADLVISNQHWGRNCFYLWTKESFFVPCPAFILITSLFRRCGTGLQYSWRVGAWLPACQPYVSMFILKIGICTKWEVAIESGCRGILLWSGDRFLEIGHCKQKRAYAAQGSCTRQQESG